MALPHASAAKARNPYTHPSTPLTTTFSPNQDFPTSSSRLRSSATPTSMNGSADPSSPWNSYAPSKTKIWQSRRSIAVVLILALAAVIFFAPPPALWGMPPEAKTRYWEAVRKGQMPSKDRDGPDPERWLRENSADKHAVTGPGLGKLMQSSKPRAALISLVRNQELDGIIQSMSQLEYRWNHKYQYPWVFFNDEPFNEEFKRATQNLTSARCYYEVVPDEHWSLPDFIDEGRFMNSLEYLGAIGVGKGWMISYRHMCRWNSGFFYKHPRLYDFDFYWRVEPDVHYFCDIDYDVFRFVRDNKIKYGFNMNILDDARSFPSLWSRTMSFINQHPDLVHPDADLDWLLDPYNGGDYNNCQFFSNFEIGDLRFFRGEANEKYFRWLDHGGGFYYERFGDAPIHTLSVAMFVPKKEIWYFRDIGYQHDINRHCPPDHSHRCDCEPTSIDENFYKLVPLESPQKKPADTCIRQFLGGDWLSKRPDWDQELERSWGGDGYHGYTRDGVHDFWDKPKPRFG